MSYSDKSHDKHELYDHPSDWEYYAYNNGYSASLFSTVQTDITQ